MCEGRGLQGNSKIPAGHAFFAAASARLNFEYSMLRLASLFFLFLPCLAFGQANWLLNQNHPVIKFFEREEIASGNLRNGYFNDIQPSLRRGLPEFENDTASRKNGANSLAAWRRYAIDELTDGENSARPILKYFYRNKAALFSYDSPDTTLTFRLNPILFFEGGKRAGGQTIYQNTRGIALDGNIDGRVWFNAYITENQLQATEVIDSFYNRRLTLPGSGKVKRFGDAGYDFFRAGGVVGARLTPHIWAQFGHNRNKIGSGYRSLLLSDDATEYLNLQLHAQVWRLHYQTIHAQMFDFNPRVIEALPQPKKYAAMHYLSFDAARWLNLGFFEAVMFYDRDSSGRGYDWNYMNPVIYYRSIEHTLNSSDNALQGFSFEVLALRAFKIYGQVIIDEFRIHDVLDRNGWAGNKQGYQIGLYYPNISFLPWLSLRAEYNRVNPYTYSSDTTAKSYTQYRQPLAHPLGANFQEAIGILTLRPYKLAEIELMTMYSRQGLDSISAYGVGADPLRRYTQAKNEYGNRLLQGELQTRLTLGIEAKYMLRHNLQLGAFAYSVTNTLSGQSRNQGFAGLNLRLNFFDSRLIY